MTPEQEKEFDRRTNASNFETDDRHLLQGDHLFDQSHYPESPYELDPDKLKDFISSLLKEERERMQELAKTKLVLPSREEWWNGSDRDIMLSDLDGFKELFAPDTNQTDS